MLTAIEVQDEIKDMLIHNLKIPLPSSQTSMKEMDILFPSHLLGFLVLEQMAANVTGHMVSTITDALKEIHDMTTKFEDDHVSAFWLSNCHQLLCIISTSLDTDLSIQGKSHKMAFQRNSHSEAALEKIRVELDILMNHVYQGWMRELKKRLSAMIVPAVIENQSLPGYICKQGGGIWGTVLKAATSQVEISIDQLVNVLVKLNMTMKCYYLEEKISRQILTELIRIIGVSAFNHLIVRRNFSTWKRGNKWIVLNFRSSNTIQCL